MLNYSEISNPTGSLIAYMSGLVKSYGGLNLAQGIPGYDPPQELLNELQDLVKSNVHQYPPGNGDVSLLESIQQIYVSIREIDQSEILVLQGATEAISLVYLYLINKLGNDWNSLAFNPIYESYSNLPEIYGNRLIRSDFLSEGKINWIELRKDILENNVKLIFVNSPGNPYGKVWTNDELSRLTQLSLELDFYILFDGVYKEIYFTDIAPFNPLKLSNPKLFYVNSFSKMLSITGWRVGYLICSEEIQGEIRHIHDYTGLCAVSVLQKAIANYLQKNDLAFSYTSFLKEELKKSIDYISVPLQNMGFRFEVPDAGYFIWARLPEGYEDGLEFSLRLFHQCQVAMVPGIHFSDRGQRYVRINIARQNHELVAAINGIESFLKP